MFAIHPYRFRFLPVATGLSAIGLLALSPTPTVLAQTAETERLEEFLAPPEPSAPAPPAQPARPSVRPAPVNPAPAPPRPQLYSNNTEVPTPEGIAAVEQNTRRYTPTLTIVSPQQGETLDSTLVEVELNYQRFPIGQDPELGLGMHVKLIVDNEEPIDYFDLSTPLSLTLSPGTHTIRAIAATPWDNSYRTRPAFQMVTFNVIEADNQNTPVFQEGVGLLTVVSPSGSYGAEPILLDYIVDGLNLGVIAFVKYTLNGNVTVTRSRQPVYLEGWQPGENELTVELVKRDNATVHDNNGTGFNRVVRTITYQPGGTDSLSLLVRGELDPIDLKDILGPDPIVYDEKGNPQLLR